MSTIIEHWRKLKENETIPPEDKEVLEKVCDIAAFTDYSTYYESAYFGNEFAIHTDGLQPVPYIGDLENAKLFILMLNPGFSASDYFAEQNSVAFATALQNNLKQRNLDKDFPFVYLNPNFIWHGGAKYWHKKFKKFIYPEDSNSNEPVALTQKIAKNIAVLELFPYHSKSFKMRAAIKEMPSFKLMIAYYQKVLLPRAVKGEIKIIIARGAKHWNTCLDTKKDLNVNNNHVRTMGAGEARSASLNCDNCIEFIDWAIQDELD